MSSAGTGEPSKAVGKQKEREQNVPLCEHAVTALWNVPENWDAVVAGDLPLRWWFIALLHLIIGKWRQPGAGPGREENSCPSGHLWPSQWSRGTPSCAAFCRGHVLALSSSRGCADTWRGSLPSSGSLSHPPVSCVLCPAWRGSPGAWVLCLSAWEQNAGNSSIAFEKLHRTEHCRGSSSNFWDKGVTGSLVLYIMTVDNRWGDPRVNISGTCAEVFAFSDIS